jgi:hypothetical protein
MNYLKHIFALFHFIIFIFIIFLLIKFVFVNFFASILLFLNFYIALLLQIFLILIFEVIKLSNDHLWPPNFSLFCSQFISFKIFMFVILI